MMAAVQFSFVSGHRVAAAFSCTCMLVLLGCSGHSEKSATQVAAKVNKEEITIHQVNFVLQRDGENRSDHIDAAKKQILEQLIDQELAVQAADAAKISRQPAVMASIDAARREIIARAYADHVAAASGKPSSQEVQTYYDANPALFKARRIYQWQEIVVESPPAEMAQLTEKLQGFKSAENVVNYLKSSRVRYSVNTAVRSAEQMPLNELGKLSQMVDGDMSISEIEGGMRVLVLAASRPEPIDETQAQRAIDQFLTNERKRKLIEADKKALREKAQIEFMGEFAAASAAATNMNSAEQVSKK